MGDIDFDELDKAVNSLMGNVAKEEDDVPKQKTLNISSTLKPGEKPAYDKLEAVAKTIGNETLVTAGERTVVEDLDPVTDLDKQPASEAPVSPKEEQQPEQPVVAEQSAPVAPAVKRPNTGRFMDVVHPSSDMKTSTTPNLVVPERAAAAPVPASASVPVPPAEVLPKTEPAPAPAPEPEKPVAPPVAPEPTAEIKAEPAPLTPFLPDAKVEKRPLGGATPSAQPEEEPEAESVPALDESNPAEEKALEIAEIESINSEKVVDKKDGDEQRPLDPEDFSAASSAEEQKLESIESAEVAEVSPLTSESIRKVESGDTESVVSGGSIAQQYTEKPKEEKGSDAEGGIYDVKDYHQPLGHPTKQKSGWGTVVLIIVIILVCIAAAAAAYLFLSKNS